MRFIFFSFNLALQTSKSSLEIFNSGITISSDLLLTLFSVHTAKHVGRHVLFTDVTNLGSSESCWKQKKKNNHKYKSYKLLEINNITLDISKDQILIHPSLETVTSQRIESSIVSASELIRFGST